MNTTVESPTQIQDIQEIAIAISAKNLNPTMLSQDFLKLSGIVPSDWELARKPVQSPRLSQVSFQNNVNIVAQPGTISFMEAIGKKTAKELKIPQVVRNYVEKLPQAEYQALNISLKSLVPFPGHQDAPRKYITGTLLSPGPWQKFGKAPLQAGINFLYQLERCECSLSINEARLQQQDKPTIPALLFAGSFIYNLASDREQERLNQLGQGIDNWETDWETFREIVYQKFLGQEYLGQQQSVFPVSVRK